MINKPKELVNESFNNDMKQSEKIHYKGELRIVGQVVNQITDKEPIGYVIMVEKTRKFKMYNVEQTKSLLERFSFVNAALENDKIINTECAMSRMPKFNTHMNVIGNHGIIILGEIIEGTKTVGYRAMDTNARIVDIEEHEIIKLNSNGVDVINAKIVKRDNKDIVSAIKSEFTKIEKSKLSDLIPERMTKAKKARNQQHIDKILGYTASTVLTQMFTKGSLNRINFNDNWAWRESDDMYGRYYEPLKEYNIFCREVAKAENKIELNDRDKDILKRIGSLPRQDRLNYCKDTMLDDTKYFMLGFLQLALNNENVYNRTLYLIKRNKNHLQFNVPIRFADEGLACDSLKKLMVEAKKISIEAQNRISNILSGQQERRIRKTNPIHKFNTKTFTTGKDIAQLGFTISKENSDMRYRTDYGYTKHLLYLGDVINDNYEKYKAEARCLGDLASIAYVEKLLHKIHEYDLDDSVEYMSRQDMQEIITIIITIAYMFNSKAMKKLVTDLDDMLNCVLDEIPNYDEIAGVDYKLNNWITMYYTSGFNVFLSDDDVYKYKSSHLIDSEIINYRQLGIRHNIIHPMLQNEFASVVSLVTPSTISPESVTKFIGQLRFL